MRKNSSCGFESAIIFGADGYIGRHIEHYLAVSGVRSITRYGRSTDIISDTLSNWTVDITDPKQLKKVNWNAETVFMFAGLTGAVTSFESPERFFQVNEIGLLNVLEAVRKSDFRPRIIFPSTRLVYKGSHLDVREDATCLPKTIYAINKVACEQMLRVYRENFDIEYTIYRICIPYGNLLRSGRPYGTISNFLRSAASNGVIKLYGDGSLRRTFTHIEDICEQIIWTCFHDGSRNQTYNILGEILSLKEIAIEICHRFKAEIDFIPFPENESRIETGDTVFDASKLQQQFDFTLKHSISRWISEIEVDAAFKS